MFILRRLTNKGDQINTCLNETYALILKESNPSEFEKALQNWGDINPDIYGFITFNNGKDIEPLYFKSKYYIMTGSGDTFSNVSLR